MSFQDELLRNMRTKDEAEAAYNEEMMQIAAQHAQYSISKIKNQELATVGQNISYKSQLYTWVGEVIRKSQNVDIAFTNQGGLRSLDGGLSSGSKITLGHLYTIMPFDHELMYCEVKGSSLKSWINSYADSNIISYKSGLSKNTIDSNTTYTVCIIDFLAGKSYSQPVFQNSTYRTSGYLLRDMMIKDIQLQQAQYGNWAPNRRAIITPNDII